MKDKNVTTAYDGKKIDEAEVRRLLALYYNGESTQEDENAIRCFFAETPRLPYDLESDACIFASLHRCADAMQSLRTSIIDRIDSIDRQEDKRTRLKKAAKFRIILSVAASIAIIAVISVSAFYKTDNSFDNNSSPNSVMASLRVDTTTDRFIDNKSLEEASEAAANQLQKPEKLIAEAVVSSPDSKIETELSPCRELTDPKEATEIINMAFAKLNDNLNRSNRALEQTNSNISTINNTLKTLKL